MVRTSGGAESGALGRDSAPSAPSARTGSGPDAPHTPLATTPTTIPAGASGPAAHADAALVSPAPIDPDLARVIGAWADLPEALRRGILAMVNADSGVRKS